MRTYSGHSSARESNALYRTNLARGQTGLSVAFDLPTQIGYDVDHPLAAGEVGRVGVPISSIDDMEALFEGIPLDRMNTSMTINATAAWLLALYVATAEKRGIERAKLSGTTQNDVLKEFLARGTYAFPPAPSMRLTTDVIAWTVGEVPKWNPINVCSYHLQEAGATPSMELAFTLANAIAYLDATKARSAGAAGAWGSRGEAPGNHAADLPKVIGRVSFFVNAGLRFVEELCKMRAFVRLWDEITRERYGVTDADARRFRYGVQVNSLGLTEKQPENNLQRIVIEMLGVVLSKDARARAIQLPCWNEALGLPRPWDQQWSLRIQQVMALETDLLEYEDLFEGSKVVEAKVASLCAEAKTEIGRIEKMGGAIAALDYMKSRLVAAHHERLRAIEEKRRIVVGVNEHTESAESPLDASEGILKVDPKAETEQIERLRTFRKKRDAAAVKAALTRLAEAVSRSENVMPASIEAAKAGVTTGEWADVLRKAFGDFRAPTGVGSTRGDSSARATVTELERLLGHKPRILIGKPGLDGHSNGAEQIAVEARDAGFEVIYLGIRLTPAEIIASAIQEGVDVVGLSVLSGGHMTLVPEVVDGLAKAGFRVPVIAGGIIPESDRRALLSRGVSKVFTPKDFDRRKVIEEVCEVVRACHAQDGNAVNNDVG